MYSRFLVKINTIARFLTSLNGFASLFLFHWSPLSIKVSFVMYLSEFWLVLKKFSLAILWKWCSCGSWDTNHSVGHEP